MGLNEVYPNSSNENETCFLLKKGIYRFCQRARQFQKEFIQEMNKLDFKISPADPCFLCHEDKSGTCMIIIHVHDMLVIGNREIIEESKTKVEKCFQSRQKTI